MKFIKSIASIGSNPSDDEETRLKKSLLVICSFPFILAGAAWGIIYILLDETIAGLIPLSYALVSAISLVFFAITRLSIFCYHPEICDFPFHTIIAYSDSSLEPDACVRRIY
jgi:hypothetical protein